MIEQALGLHLDAHELGYQHVALRAFLVFVAALVFVRLGAKRSFGRKTAFDIILMFILGSVLSRAINGNAAFFPSLIGGLVLVLVHRLAAMMAFHLHWFGHLIKGSDDPIIQDGKVLPDNLRKNYLSDRDLQEDLRLKSYESPDQVQSARLERSGEISVIGRKDKKERCE